jgi:hypothetical protein
MNVRKLKKELGQGFQIGRDRAARRISVEAAGLRYGVEEQAFRDEAELAEHLRSKMPAMRVMPG